MSARLGRIALLAAGLAAGGAALLAVWSPSRVAQGPLDEAVAPTDPATVRVPMPDPSDAQVQPSAASQAPAGPVSPAFDSPTGESSLVDTAVGVTPLREATESGPTWAGPQDAYPQPGEAEIDPSPTTASTEAVDVESLSATPLDSDPTSLPPGGYVEGSVEAPGARPESSPIGGQESSQLPGQ